MLPSAPAPRLSCFAANRRVEDARSRLARHAPPQSGSGLEGVASTWPTPRRLAKEGLASIGIVCASHALVQAVSGHLPIRKARLFRLGFVPARTVVAIVIGRNPRGMIRPRHLSSDQPRNIYATRSRCSSAARCVSSTLHPASAGRALSFAAPCPFSSPSMFDLPFPDGKTCKNQREDKEKREFTATRRVSQRVEGTAKIFAATSSLCATRCRYEQHLEMPDIGPTADNQVFPTEVLKRPPTEE